MASTTNPQTPPAGTSPTTPPPAGALQPQGEVKPNMAERFTAKVMKEFGSNVGAPQITDYQRQLIQGYFIAIDRALKAAEEERLRKNANNKDHNKYDNPLPVSWETVNLNDLALDVVHYARMGLDMMQDNHLFPIPYKNNKTQKYDMTLMLGYNGIQYIAEKYAVETPVAVTIELVYETDTFRPIKKDSSNRVESYEFTINSPFDRGKVVGGFGYIEYADPLKNELVIMTLHDIEKRKPKYASANFWGGTQKVWENGKQVETETDGWYEEMCLKTIKREVYGSKHIPRDPKKIDDAYQYMKMREAKIAEMEAQAEIDANANGVIIDTTGAAPEAPAALPEHDDGITLPQTDPKTGEIIGSETTGHAAQAGKDGQQTLGGPTF